MQVDWKKVKKDVNKAKKHLKKKANKAAPELNSFIEEVEFIIEKNFNLFNCLRSSSASIKCTIKNYNEM